jgi:hypothetical protein
MVANSLWPPPPSKFETSGVSRKLTSVSAAGLPGHVPSWDSADFILIVKAPRQVDCSASASASPGLPFPTLGLPNWG